MAEDAENDSGKNGEGATMFEVIPGVELRTANGEAASQFLGDVAPCKYLKRKILGRGAFGEAFIVERMSDQRLLAAKVMDLHSMSAKDRRYAYTEIRCLAACHHFAVVSYVEDMVLDGKQMVIIMEYADGGDLHNFLKRAKAPLSEKAAAAYFLQLILAINHIHDNRMIHRDVKTANLFLTSGGLLKIGDFGFSQAYDQTVSNAVAGTFLGTPYYLAPEMWQQCRYGKKADIWACGIVLYELLTAKRPFQGATMVALKDQVLAGLFEVPVTVSREMAELLVSLLQQSPEKRPTAKSVLRLPIMQHYLLMFKDFVQKNPDLTPEVKTMVMDNVADAERSIVVVEEEKKTAKFEMVVKKESGGAWKDRVLTLSDGFLIMSLARGREATSGSERSKRLPLSAITSAIPIEATAGNLYLFAVNTTNSNIIIGCTQKEDRDKWVQVMLSALDLA